MSNERKVYSTDTENSLLQDRGPYRQFLSGGMALPQSANTTHEVVTHHKSSVSKVYVVGEVVNINSLDLSK